MNIKNALLATLAALAIGHSSAGLGANAPSYGRSAAPAPLEGTWVATINPILCTTTPAGNAGDDVPGAPQVTAYLTCTRTTSSRPAGP